jgi:hypothetical protein
MQHTNYINAVAALQIEQEVILKVLDGQHPHAPDKGYFRITGKPMLGMRDRVSQVSSMASRNRSPATGPPRPYAGRPRVIHF